jgi:hypothetical protein
MLVSFVLSRVVAAGVQACSAAYVEAVAGMQQYLSSFAAAAPTSKQQQLEQVRRKRVVYCFVGCISATDASDALHGQHRCMQQKVASFQESVREVCEACSKQAVQSGLMSNLVGKVACAVASDCELLYSASEAAAAAAG